MRKGTFYIINNIGEIEATPKLNNIATRTSCFVDGIAAVKGEEGWGFINRRGDFVIKPKFENVDQFSCGLAAVAYGNEPWGNPWGYIDKSGKFVIPPKYTMALPFRNDIALVGNDFGGARKYGFIDKRGKLIIDTLFEEAYVFHDDLATVKIGEKYGFINRKGKLTIAPEFEEIGCFSENLANVKVDGKFGYIDKQWNFVIEPKYDSAGIFSDGLAWIKVGDKYGYIDKNGNYEIEPMFDNALNFQDSIACVECDGKWGCVDRKGNFIIKPSSDRIIDFHDGMAIMKEGDKYGYIDKSGSLVIAPIYDYCCFFSEGVAIVASERPINSSSTKKHSRTSKSLGVQRSRDNMKHNRPSSSSSKGSVRRSDPGCYIATAVYGSYDCPEVWTLRRYRDKVLDNTWYGRLFIRFYYAISPTLVKWFGATEWFRVLFRTPLNRWVKNLNRNGFEDSPYKDKY